MKKFHRPTAKRKYTQQFAFGFAIIIGIVLLIAALGKLFYPAEALRIIDIWAGSIEILFVAALFFFRRNWWMWLGAMVLFAAWSGYSIYWHGLKLPCSCMGSIFEIPTTLTLTLDLFFFAASMGMAYLLKAKVNFIYLATIVSFFVALAGYAFAAWVYQTYVLRGGIA